jgi:formylglycine-generating enzyme required for sulfatase activity
MGAVLRRGWVLGTAAVLAGWLAADAAAQSAGAAVAPVAAPGVNEPAARFRGPLAYDFSVTNVQWEAATPAYSYVTFDLYWSYSWRAKWTEPAKTSATGNDTEVENWDAAWVFVKFLPEKDTPEAQARNHWLHATLDQAPASHILPAGVTNFVKLADDGARGMGMFLYRAALGHGVNDWKKIKLRWNHPSAAAGARFDPARAAVQVHAIPMVYVPGGAFKVGTGCPSGIYEKFADGPDFPVVNTMHNGRSKDQEFSGLTDGSWRGGNSSPFMLDAEWNAPAKEGTRARRLGLAPGELWGTHTYWEVNLSWLGVAGPLSNEYPTGYEPFYCMKYEVTQGQYVDFLNSLPPDVAAERAFIGSEVGSDAGLHTETATVIAGPGREPMQVQEKGGCTIYSSADAPAKTEVAAEHAEEGVVSEEEKKKNREIDGLIGDAFDDKKSKDAKKKKTALAATGERPVYGARLPFRRARGTTASDAYAYAVWAGLRPMSVLEANKAGNGVRDPLAPPDWTGRPNLEAKMEIADLGRPTERFSKGNSAYGSDVGLRVGCFLSPESDRGMALATYWGISEFSGTIVPLGNPIFRGTHGNGETAPGKPGAPVKRTVGKFTAAPADWPALGAYLGGHFVGGSTRLAISAENRIVKPAAAPETDAAKVKKPVLPIPPLDGRQDDFPRVTNVRIDAGKKSSTISFDLAWNNAWRAKWTEPAAKNCTGKPLTIESWDAAWVFVKFRPKGTMIFSHVTLSPDAADHGKPAGAALETGLANDGKQGIGVFLYRDTVGQGANEFKGVKLRWQHVEDQADPATVELSVHAIPMVYVPDGAFRSKSPCMYAKTGSWTPEVTVCPLTTIDTPDASQPGGHANFSTNEVRVTADWPNGYSAFYCMKYAINQGEYARFLTEAAPDPALAGYNGQYGYGPHNAARRYAGGLYGICGYTIRYSSGELRYEADVPERPAKFLSDADIHSFTAWAGLRPLTNLEYEKACRGPRAVAKEEEAWAPGACAPAAGLAQFVPSIGGHQVTTTGRLAWPGLSYWGIRDMSQSGAVIEWPAVVIEDGREFTPNHGTGSPNPPGGWVFTSRGEWMRYMWQGFPLSQIGIWVLPEDCTSLPGDIGAYSSTRTGRYGARAVRTAAGRSNADAPLQVAPLPELTGFDLAIVNLAGQYKNEGDQPVKVTLDSALPVESFPFGVTSRTFTAAAKAVTPFKVPLVLTRSFAKVARRGGGGLRLPVQLRRANGEVVAESGLQISREALSRGPSSLLSLDGGRIELRLTNATEQQLALAFELPSSAGVRMVETRRSVTLAAGCDGQVVFPVPCQNFPQDGACVVPYRLTIGNTAVPCETAAEVANIGRWWLISRSKAGPKMAGGGGGGGGDLDMDGGGEVAGLEGLFSANAAEAFALAAPGKGWKAVTNKVGQVDFAPAGALPTRESIAVAVTRAFAAADADAAVAVKLPAIPKEATSDPFFVRVYINDKPVFDSSLPPRDRNKPCRLRKGMNTVVAEWHSCEFAESKGGVVTLQFNDARGGKPLPELFLDMNRK